MSPDTRRIDLIGYSKAGFHVRAVTEAERPSGLAVTAFAGAGSGHRPGLAKPLLSVPSDDSAPAQGTHITHGRLTCRALGRWLGVP